MTFIVYGLPRSRSYWLSRFLSYGGWHCGHDELRRARSLDDVKTWFAQPHTGTVETAAAPWWRLVQEFRPDIRVAVVRRPLAEVVDSLAKLGFPPDNTAVFMARYDRKLDQIERRVPGALSVSFADLATEAACARLFEHCLPFKHDPAWWAGMAPLNLQTDMAATIRYAHAYRGQTEKLRAVAARHSVAALHSRRAAPPDGITIAEESLDAYIEDCADLRRDHSVIIGEAPDYHLGLNFELMRRVESLGGMQTMIARCNGRAFGYLLTIIGPSFDDAEVMSAHHTTFFADSAFPGLGMKLTRLANEALRAKGVGEIIFRAGVRGDGPRLGAFYRRLGAEDYGRLYRLPVGRT